MMCKPYGEAAGLHEHGGEKLPAPLSAASCSKQCQWLGENTLSPALWWDRRKMPKISGTCKCVGGTAPKEMGVFKLQELR